MAETMICDFAQTFGRSLPGIPVLDEVGMLLSTYDHGRLPAEMANWILVRSKEDEPLRLVERVTYLQKLGLIPADINPTLFISQARHNGSSDSTILIDLLFRGGIKQRDELISLKKSSTEISHKTSSPGMKQTSPETVMAQTFFEGLRNSKTRYSKWRMIR